MSGEIDTFFPDDGSTYTALVRLPDGTAIGQNANSTYFFFLPVGVQTIQVVQTTPAGTVQSTPSAVTVQAGQVQTVQTQVFNAVIDKRGPTAEPVITSSQIVLDGGVATLILKGNRRSAV